MNFLVTHSISVRVVFILIPILPFCALTLMYSGTVYHFANERICMFQMVGATRGTPEGFGNASGNGSQQPPPPPPNLAEYLAAQTELLRQLVQGQQQWGGRNDHQPQSAMYTNFFGTQPPLFNRMEEPLDADAWIKTIESKFYLLNVPCSEANKACFAA